MQVHLSRFWCIPVRRFKKQLTSMESQYTDTLKKLTRKEVRVSNQSKLEILHVFDVLIIKLGTVIVN